MARKNVFGGTMATIVAKSIEQEERLTEAPAPPAPSDAPTSSDRKTAPNVRYFQMGMQEELRRTAQDIDTGLIDQSRFADRLNIEEGIADLIESIRARGQQVPALLRPKPDSDRFEVVYGRRRIAACRALGIKVRAFVVSLSDDDAIITQGIENNSRLETSFIERAHFINQMVAAKVSYSVIHEALGVDKSILTRMTKIYQGVPYAVIQTIGPAHGTGRRMWESLRLAIEGNSGLGTQALVDLVDESLPSEERVKALITALKGQMPRSNPKTAPPAAMLVGAGKIHVARTGRKLNIKAESARDEAFLAYLESRMAALYDEFTKCPKTVDKQ
jgi:ParB family chromosome partitioning protein